MGKTGTRSLKEKAESKKYSKVIDENKTLLLKNQELAETLSENSRIYQQLLEQRSKLQRENLDLIVENRELNDRLGKINAMSQNHLEMAIRSSKMIASIIFQSCDGGKTSGISNGGCFNEDLITRTKRVKTVLSRRVIHQPSVNLPLMSTEEFLRLEAITNTPDGDFGDSTSTTSTNANPRLSVLMEIDEEITSPRASVSNEGFISDIINDFRVYLSALDRVFPAHTDKAIEQDCDSGAAMELKRNNLPCGNDSELFGVQKEVTIEVDQDAGGEGCASNLPFKFKLICFHDNLDKHNRV